ncbi:hypothetical protein RHGRI_037994 [Rhododendron griersonianum]|uniref:Uncharacterized protein n=1 Tax=Rhododendron griersonianum TaxID=479676 RepID=A0AAV6HUJ7_9ERIC|nr:hypothetical protein RHGRI_037994 [Rhododendron griersonianum]
MLPIWFLTSPERFDEESFSLREEKTFEFVRPGCFDFLRELSADRSNESNDFMASLRGREMECSLLQNKEAHLWW